MPDFTIEVAACCKQVADRIASRVSADEAPPDACHWIEDFSDEPLEENNKCPCCGGELGVYSYYA